MLECVQEEFGMRSPQSRWVTGIAALLFGAAAPAFAAPPRSGGDDRIDTQQIFDNAKERAADLDQDQSRSDPSQDRPAETAGDAFDADAARGNDAQDLEHQADRPDRQAGHKAASDESAAGRLPEGIDRLGLTERERAAMLRVIAEYDRQTQELLDRFRKLHAKAIGIEAISLAESARQNGGSILTAGTQGRQNGRSGQRQQGDQAGQRTAGFRPGDVAPQAPQDRAAANAEDKPAEEIKEIGQASPFAGPSADIWRQLHEIHLEAVKVEAQKLAAIEKLLSPEKLEQLHRFRAEALSRQGADQPQSDASEDRPDRPDLQNADENPEEQRRDAQSGRLNGDVNKSHIDPNRSKKPLTERRQDEED
jgi:hypothetical protein